MYKCQRSQEHSHFGTITSMVLTEYHKALFSQYDSVDAGICLVLKLDIKIIKFYMKLDDLIILFLRDFGIFIFFNPYITWFYIPDYKIIEL